MADETKFRDPVFVRNDNTTTIAASVVVWHESIGGVSVRLSNGSESVLISACDWQTLVGCVNGELSRVED